MTRWHSQFSGGHKLDKPQTGLAVTKVVTTAAAVRLCMLAGVGYKVKVT